MTCLPSNNALHLPPESYLSRLSQGCYDCIRNSRARYLAQVSLDVRLHLARIRDIFSDTVFRVGLWYGLVMSVFIYAENSGTVQLVSFWFVLALIAIVLPSAPALFRLAPLWRNFLVPFTGPPWAELPAVAKRFMLWTLGGLVAAIPISVIMYLTLGAA